MVEPLKYHVQAVLPTVYDDSLSYYELLNKVVQKLNEVIDQMNDYEERTSVLEMQVNYLMEYIENNINVPREDLRLLKSAIASYKSSRH